MAFVSSICELIIYQGENFVLCSFITALIFNGTIIGDIAYHSMWYRMSRNEQVVVEMIIARSQKMVQLKGLSVFDCSLNMYAKVSRVSC